MKLPLIALACLALTSSGCFFIVSSAPESLKPVAQLYSSISKGASRAEVETKLGRVGRQDGDAWVWEERLDQSNYVAARVWFDNADRVAKVEVSRSRGNQGPGFSSEVHTTVTR